MSAVPTSHAPQPPHRKLAGQLITPFAARRVASPLWGGSWSQIVMSQFVDDLERLSSEFLLRPQVRGGYRKSHRHARALHLQVAIQVGARRRRGVQSPREAKSPVTSCRRPPSRTWPRRDLSHPTTSPRAGANPCLRGVSPTLAPHAADQGVAAPARLKIVYTTDCDPESSGILSPSALR